MVTTDYYRKYEGICQQFLNSYRSTLYDRRKKINSEMRLRNPNSNIFFFALFTFTGTITFHAYNDLFWNAYCIALDID